MIRYLNRLYHTKLVRTNIKFTHPLHMLYGRFVHTPIMLWRNGKNPCRRLEIGPGPKRIPGFETASIIWQPQVDYVCDASKRLPFKENSISLIYASHMLEHVPWYQIEKTLLEWRRVLKKGGWLEIFVPNGYLIAKTFVEAEDGVTDNTFLDGWYKFNPSKDPCIWANGRIFSYGDENGGKGHPNWHLSIFSERYLKKLLHNAGFIDIAKLNSSDVRGYDHGWINLGLKARKP